MRNVRWAAAIAVLLLTSTLSGQQAPSAPDHPVVACATALSDAWSAVGSGEAALATAALVEADDRGCRVLSTRAERSYLEGRVALLQGDSESAIEALRRARRADRVPRGDRPGRAEILYSLGLAYEVAGRRDDALEVYAELATEYPADGRVPLILPLLDHPPATSSRERVEAAERAVDKHNYSAAERLLLQVVYAGIGAESLPEAAGTLVSALGVAISAGPDIVGEGIYQLGYLWYYWIREKNPQAISLLRAVASSDHGRRDDALYYLARSHMRAEQYDEARDTWAEFAERFPRDSRAHEATYYRGWLYMDRERFAESLAGFEDYLDDFSGGARADRARWYLGWSYYRLEQFDAAIGVFERMAQRGGYLYGAKGRYWLGRCQEALGQTEAAQETYEALADRYAFNYYGLLANRRLGVPVVPPRSHTLLPSPATRIEELAADHADLEALLHLLRRGDAFRAARYYRDERPDRDVDGAIDQLLMRHAAGDAWAEFDATRGHGGGTLREPPNDADALSFWLRRFPRPYTHWIEAATAPYGLDPLLVWSHMQIESHYNGTYISYADAQGLLQLIPVTGQRVAEMLGESYTEGILMDPVVNIRYGVGYLAGLVEEFGGQLPLAIGGYNAGAHAMQRWVDENSDLPFDAFVEEIPYDQAREYVKKVIGMYAHYLYLYADDATMEATFDVLLPETVSPTYLGEITW